MRYVRTDQHVADPQLIRPRSLEATEHIAWLLRQSGAVQAALLEVLANRALSDTDAMAREQAGADLCGGACRQLHP